MGLFELIRSLFQPGGERETIKGEVELSAFRFEPAEKKHNTAVIICHGVGMFKRLYTWLAHAFTEAGFQVWTFNFRGHGLKKQGKLTITGALNDVNAVISHVKSKGYKNVILVGHSMGGIVSLKAATRRNDIKAIVLLGCPASLESVPNRALFVFGLHKLAVPMDLTQIRKEFSDFDPSEDIKKLKIPALLVYGNMDQILLLFGQKPETLRKKAKPGAVDFVLVPIMGHEPFIRKKYREKLIEWVKKHA
ncbi:MAG: alpha/beta hydrolase [archaeon]